ncbi:sugar phosphate isomerase/epimerase family protein [Jiangella endophytica]|uniref:sugar phosphate isomerase/epimerase family protein n=1 Tax=Jiangella endophytica TaxID=1623398 RepID=UPI000E3489C1|nr:TIM barrel protein [Jiangella endophytica]
MSAAGGDALSRAPVGSPTIGVQAMMLREQVREQGAFPVWKRLADLGFRSVEVSQIPLTPDTVRDIRRGVDELGIRVAAMSARMGPAGGPNDSLIEQFDKVVADSRALSTDMIRIGMMPMEALESLDALLAFSRATEEKARALADEGIGLCYHNHHIEFARIEGRHLLEIIRTEAPSLRFELDVHWIHRGGMDPVRVLADYAGVVDLVHLKDYRVSIPPAEAFAALSAGDRARWNEHWSTIVQFAEVGAGNLDFTAIIDQALASGAQHLLIEQDELYGRDIFDCLADSRDRLVAFGYASLL